VLQQTTPVLAAAGGRLMVLILLEDPLKDHPLGYVLPRQPHSRRA